MIIPTEYAVALICPDCGSLILKKFSLFSLNGGELEISCKCGAVPCFVGLAKEGYLYMEIESDCCADPHEFIFSLKEFGEGPFFGLACEVSKQGIGYFGLPKAVAEVLKEYALPVLL